MRFTKNTPQDASKVLRLPRKMTMDASKVLRLPRKLQHIFWKRRKSIAPATQNDLRHVAEHVWMSRSATPATRNEAARRLKPPKRTTSVKLPIGTAIRSSRERLRTVALANATSSEHTLNPQTPRVKREPLLRIREKEILGRPKFDTQSFFVFFDFWEMYVHYIICVEFYGYQEWGETKKTWGGMWS